MAINLKINGVPYKVLLENHPIDITLNTFIRRHAHLTGTKYMCLEAGCGVCICVIRKKHPDTNQIQTLALNSCTTLLNVCDGWEIVTIEGLGDRKQGYHPIQQRLADMNGSQCGYCSPGMIMNMYGLLESRGNRVSMEEIENSFAGNICRCTGYRAILDTMKSFATDSSFEYVDLCRDIEELGVCSRTGDKCLQSCKKRKLRVVFEDNRTWSQVYSVSDIFQEFTAIGEKKYILVCGDTAHGVYRRPPDIEVFIDVNRVSELQTYTIGNSIELGANLRLSEIMEILTTASSRRGFEYCAQIVHHLDLVAHIPVRNVGSIAGNLMTKHDHNDFPSDVFLLMETVNARFIIMQSPTSRIEVSPEEFLKIDMNKKILFRIILQAYPKETNLFNSYKITVRAQNTHALINAAFLLRMATDRVVSARVCYGGISPEFVHASNTEQYLVGKKLFTNETIQGAVAQILGELHPEPNLLEPSPDYRRRVACGLFYRFVLNASPANLIKLEYKSGAQMQQRPLSHATQSFDSKEKSYPLTQPMPKLESISQCSGEAEYIDDIPPIPGELWAAFVHATQVNARIVEIDPSEALAIPGVVAFFSAKDIPGRNSFVYPPMLTIIENEEVFCSSEVKYYDQPVGIVVAESFDKAYKASERVKILYEKPREPVMATMEDVFRHKAYHRIKEFDINESNGSTKTEEDIEETLPDVHKASHGIKKFDVRGRNSSMKEEELLNEASQEKQKHSSVTEELEADGSECLKNREEPLKDDVSRRIDGIFDVGSQYHYTMELQCCVCIPTEDGMEVHPASQWLDLTHTAIAQAINMNKSNITVYVRRLGGGFGSKISRNSQIACACAIACKLLNRPIRFIQRLESIMGSIGRRFACHSEYEIETDNLGKIRRLKNIYYEDSGASYNETPVLLFTFPGFHNCYAVDLSWTVIPKTVITNAPSHTWCRAPGSLEGIAMIENIMEHIAYVTKQDPIDVRMRNLRRGTRVEEMIPEFLKSSEYRDRRDAVNEFNKANRWRKRGIGFSLMDFTIFYFGMYQATVSIFQADGSVAISHSGTEMGQGMHTKAAQVAAYILGIPLKLVKVLPTNSLNGANGTITGASVGSEGVCNAIRKACEVLLARLTPFRVGKTWIEAIQAAYFLNVSLTATSSSKASDLRGYPVWGVCASELEIDILTGQVMVLRVDILEDAGESLNPTIDVGQVEGAFVMGIGFWLTEKLVFDRQIGKLVSRRTWNYKPPGVKDIPVDFRVSLLKNAPNSDGFLRSKATGEPAICLAVSILFALRHALASSRADAGLPESWIRMGAPSTAEEVFLETGTSPEMFKLN